MTQLLETIISLRELAAKPCAWSARSQAEKYSERFSSGRARKSAWLDEACQVTVSKYVQQLGGLPDESTNFDG